MSEITLYQSGAFCDGLLAPLLAPYRKPSSQLIWLPLLKGLFYRELCHGRRGLQWQDKEALQGAMVIQGIIGANSLVENRPVGGSGGGGSWLGLESLG